MNKTYLLKDSEAILPDDYPVHFGFCYIVDCVAVRCLVPTEFNECTIGEWKNFLKAEEIRKLEIFRPEGEVMIGDMVIPSGAIISNRDPEGEEYDDAIIATEKAMNLNDEV